MSEPSITNSELLKENAELKQRIQELEKSVDQDEIGIFVRDIANSINNLLMGIRGIAAVSLLDFEPSHPHYENLKQIEAQVQSGVVLTNQLLEFAIDHRLDVSSRGEKGVLAASDKEKTDSGAGIIAMGTETILLVDDERNIREVGQKMLESMGYNVYVAANGREALAVYSDKKDEIALVILDIIMPVMSGGETYDRLKEINPNVNVLLSSGDSICGMVQEILDRGCQGFIQKAFQFFTILLQDQGNAGRNAKRIIDRQNMKVAYRDDVNGNFHNYFSSIDIHFGNFIADLTAKNSDYLFLAAVLASRAVRSGHVCLDLNAQAGSEIIASAEGAEPVSCPELKEWLHALQSSFCVGKPSEFKPLILDDRNRLYLQRYWQYEQDIAGNILSRISSSRRNEINKLELADKLQLYFPENPAPGKTNWQKVAATAAMLKNFVVISGSPGTGKTTTITKIMALLLDVEKRNLRIALAAPTGKAAARLQESVRKTKLKLTCSDAVKALIPDDAQTIHRLLGSRGKSPYFQFNESNSLPYDLVVVDEASMADLPLLAKLFQALSAEARIILLGDKDQLASVDAGVVLGDICAGNAADIYSRQFADQIAELSGEKLTAEDIPAGLQDVIIQLQTNFRFAEESGINILANCVRRGDAAKAMDLLRRQRYSDIGWTDLNSGSILYTKFAKTVIAGYSAYLEAVKCAADTNIIFDCLEKFRILCALRVGNWGTQRINSLVEKILSEAGLISRRGLFYAGMPVMVTRNDYQLNLFNGDVGIILPDGAQDREMLAHFRDEQGKIIKITPSRLPQAETVWATTVHKSQGSEYDRVLLVLSDRDISVATRELVYTGITRARRNVRIWAAEAVLANAISRRIKRESGLTDALFPEKTLLYF